MILPDYPIENKKEDQLKRFPLASKVADMISNFSGNESFVIGIEGKWGAGKTSFINLALKQLDNEKIVHFTFNPWSFSDESSLLRDFFINLSEVVEQTSGRKIGKRIKKYASKLSELDLGIPYGGLLKFVLQLFVSDTSLKSLRKKLDSALNDIDKKIVIVIDDIDRLDNKETKLILKLVKLTADFPKTIFVLAYDRSRVEDRITEEENGLDGGEYLKKIIQVSFSLPLPDQQELNKILFKDLDVTLESIYGKAELSDKEESRWGNLFHNGYKGLFSTIRDIKRYISSLRLDWTIMGRSDVNKVDFLGIEAIRVFAPRFYEAIPANKETFVRTGGTLLYKESDIAKARQERYEDLLKIISDAKVRNNIDEICKQLFPQLSAYSSGSSDEHERDLRICSPERFDFYFQLGIPYGEISEKRMDKIIEDIKNVEVLKDTILQFQKENRLRKLLTKFLRRREGLVTDQLGGIISVLWNLEKEIGDEREAVFDMDDVSTQVLRLGFNFLKEIPKEERKNNLIKWINSTENVYFATHLVAVIEQEYQKVGNSEEHTLREEELLECKKMLVDRIKRHATDGSLIQDNHLTLLLHRWNDWDSNEHVADYIRKVISTQDGLLQFLEGCVSKVLSTGGNYYTLNKKTIESLIPISEVEEKVNAISDSELLDMSESQQEAIDLFRNPKGDW